MICDQIAAVVAEKLVNVFHFTVCIRIYLFSTVFNICKPTTAPLFVRSNGKKKPVANMCHPWNKNRMSNLSRV